MINAILNGLLSAINTLISGLLSPLDNLVTSLFPNMSSILSNFNTFVSTYLGGGLGYFMTLFPPLTANVIRFALTFAIAYGTASITYWTFTRIFELIQKIKFW